MLDDAFSVTVVLVQVSVAGGARLTLGAVLFCETVTDAVDVHPDDGLVTVTVYVPAAVTAFVAALPPPLHKYVTPAVPEDAVNVTLGLEQVIVAGAAILAPGGVPD